MEYDELISSPQQNSVILLFLNQNICLDYRTENNILFKLMGKKMITIVH